MDTDLTPRPSRRTHRARAAALLTTAAALSVAGLGCAQAASDRPAAGHHTSAHPTARASVAPAKPRWTVVDRLARDLDGDGVREVVRILEPRRVSRPQQLRVRWGTGGRSSRPLPNTMARMLRAPVDLDGDGTREIVTAGGGGEYGEYRFFATSAQRLRPVDVVDGDHTSRVLDASTGAEWEPVVDRTGVVTIHFVDPAHTVPGTVDVRAWTFAGATLTGADDTTTGCADIVDYEYVVTPGPCT
ncbi:MAG: VCBS repeat-containing protein [Nocardioidaceae bacterium]